MSGARNLSISSDSLNKRWDGDLHAVWNFSPSSVFLIPPCHSPKNNWSIHCYVICLMSLPYKLNAWLEGKSKLWCKSILLKRILCTLFQLTTQFLSTYGHAHARRVKKKDIIKAIHISSHASEQTGSEIQIVRSHLNSFVLGYSKISIRVRPQQTRQHFKCCKGSQASCLPLRKLFGLCITHADSCWS